jgi:hypothetical protein
MDWGVNLQAILKGAASSRNLRRIAPIIKEEMNDENFTAFVGAD